MQIHRLKIHLFSSLGLLVNGGINVVITTIEKRFGLRSSQTGLVASGYDIASFVCLVPVTYFGGRSGASKPRWIGIGMALMGIGSLVFSLPHFLVGAYRATNAETNICSHENSNSTVSVVNGNGAHCRSKPKKKTVYLHLDDWPWKAHVEEKSNQKQYRRRAEVQMQYRTREKKSISSRENWIRIFLHKG